MLLCVDIGNSNITTGVFRDETLVHEWRLNTLQGRTMDEYGLVFMSFLRQHKIRSQQVKGVAISSVVPPLNHVFQELCAKYFESPAFFVEPGIKTGLRIRYQNPKELGSDRIVNAVAGHNLFGGPLIIVDFGTATTFCGVSAAGDYLGGAILPGIGISTEALFERAARLPRVDMARPETVLGRSTLACMQSGMVFGFVAQLEGMVTRIKEAMEEESPGGKIRVLATGGFAQVLARETHCIDVVDPDLTLKGLKALFDMNTRPEKAK